MAKLSRAKIDKRMAQMKIRATATDNFIGWFSPLRKAKRMYYRAAMETMQRKYDGASLGRRTSGWKTHSTSANSEIAVAQSKLRDRSRDLVRNNPYAARGIQVISSNVVGRGIRTQLKTKSAGGRGQSVKARNQKLNQLWRAWAGTTACDHDGRHDFIGLQKLIMRSVAESGEVFVRRRVTERFSVKGPDGEVIEVPPFRLQVLESDFLASNLLSRDSGTGNRIIQGIEFDEFDNRVAYHFFRDHPGSFNIIPVSDSSTVRIPAEEVSHVYRMDRPGQIRGVPWLSADMLRLRDFDEFEDAQLVRQKIAAMWTAFVHDLEGLDDSAIIDSANNENELGEKMEPGTIEILPPGKDIRLASPPGVTGYQEYSSVILHSIAAGLGITYEDLTSDYSQVNFSSARMAQIGFFKNVDAWRWQMVIPQFITPATDWFLTFAELLGTSTRGVRAVHTPPKREFVDPTKEIPAAIKAVRGGFISLSETIRQHGQDPEQHFEELAEDNATLDSLGLTLDTDPRKTTQQGMAQIEPSDDVENENV